MVIVAVEILFINALEYVLFDELHSEKNNSAEILLTLEWNLKYVKYIYSRRTQDLNII